MIQVIKVFIFFMLVQQLRSFVCYEIILTKYQVIKYIVRLSDAFE
jgi:hypothetical protein